MTINIKKYLPWALASAGVYLVTRPAEAGSAQAGAPLAPSPYVAADAGTSYTQVGGNTVPMAGTLNILGLKVPYNLDPTYSPIYKSYFQGPVNQAAADQISSAPQTKNLIALSVLAIAIGLSVSYQAGRGGREQR